MASNYDAIRADNLRRRGTDFQDIGEFLSEQLYSDPTHFVFELLQNTEDAYARLSNNTERSSRSNSVKFALFPDRLELRHFGVPFSDKDVRGISDVLRGTKASDQTQIGRFGIGFKSVYSVTRTPEVHSNDEHFAIRRYIEPHQIIKREVLADETLIVLPFDHPTRTPEDVYPNLLLMFSKFNARNLMFLEHLSEMTWSDASNASGSFIKKHLKDGDGQAIVLTEASNESCFEERWLLFSQQLSKSLKHSGRLSVSFRLGEHENSIVPTPNYPLFATFPTENSTGLGFLLNGPFDTTPARDNIVKSLFNSGVIADAAELTVKSLKSLRQRGLLSPSALMAMPVDSTQHPVDGFFRPVFDRVREALISENLLPTSDSKYVSAGQAKIARVDAVRTLVTNAQLNQIHPSELDLHWLSAEFSTDNFVVLRQYLLQELGIKELDPESTCRKMHSHFFSKQSDQWMENFYRFAADRPALWRASYGGRTGGVLRSLDFIRLQDGQHVAPFSPDGIPNAYIYSVHRSELPFIKKKFTNDSELLKFFKELGLTEPDRVDNALLLILPKYPFTTAKESNALVVSQDDNIADVSGVVSALRNATPNKRAKLRSTTSMYRFLAATNALTGAMSFKSPDEVYVHSVALDEFFEGNPAIWFFAESYYRNSASIVRELNLRTTYRIQMAEPDSLGFVTLSREKGNHRRGVSGFDSNFNIEGLDFALRSPSFSKSKAIWNLLCTLNRPLKGTVEFSSKQNYENIKSETAWSIAGHLLNTTVWLFGKDQKPHLPSQLTLEDLPDEFSRNELLASWLGMKTELADAAKLLGMDVADVRQFLMYGTEFREFLKSKQKMEKVDTSLSAGSEFLYASELEERFRRRSNKLQSLDGPNPPTAVSDPSRRRERVHSDMAASIVDEPAVRERFQRSLTRNWESRDPAVKEFLEQQYRGLCQICNFGFSKHDQRPYFEAVHLVSVMNARWLDQPGNSLCLCANCNARYQHGEVDSELPILEQLMSLRTSREIPASALLAIEFNLCNVTVQLVFTERHIIEVQELLRAAEVLSNLSR